MTPEYVIESPDGGGLAGYVARLARALAALGHQPEVFTLSARDGEVASSNGIRVQHVFCGSSTWVKIVSALTGPALRPRTRAMFDLLRGARMLARAFEKRHREEPFDIVQSSDYGFAGLFLPGDLAIPHVVRCSWAADLFLALDGRRGIIERLTSSLERRCIRGARAAYAPSRFVADYYASRHDLCLGVVLPPLPTLDAGEPPATVPARYLMFMGLITPRKGTDVLARALEIAWRQAPEIEMIWAGKAIVPGEMERYRALWGPRAVQVHWLGAIVRTSLHAIVRRAVAVIVPSRADNLPNSAIESLALGVPVIGSRGASIDEIVDDGCGELVAVGDADALAEALLRAWRGEAAWNRNGFTPPSKFAMMEPSIAAESLLEFVARIRTDVEGTP